MAEESLIRSVVPAVIAGLIVFFLLTSTLTLVIIYGNGLNEISGQPTLPTVWASFVGALGFLAAVYLKLEKAWA